MTTGSECLIVDLQQRLVWERERADLLDACITRTHAVLDLVETAAGFPPHRKDVPPDTRVLVLFNRLQRRIEDLANDRAAADLDAARLRKQIGGQT